MAENDQNLDRAATQVRLPSPPSVAVEAGELDLATCENEPIHIPGSIQPHGFLLALNEQDEVVIASATAAQYLQRPLESIFGKTLVDLLGQELGARILASLVDDPLTTASRLMVAADLPGREGTGERFEIAAHLAENSAHVRTVLEFERSVQSVDIERINSRLFNFIGLIRAMQQPAEICEAAVDEVQALTGCDRVLVYRFDEDGNGLVLAEKRLSQQFASYLGLRFPASDVPAQARRMYELNRVRIIPNVDYEASPLLSPGGPATELDLSRSILRSVSPIHRQYMRNMGTACSMSVSIMIDGHLWGLISCHHHEPRYVPLRLRSACDFVMQIVSSQIESRQNALHLQRALAAKSVQTRLLASMAAEDSYSAGLTRVPNTLMELAGADGAAVVVGLGVSLFGITPTEKQVLQIVDWFRRREDNEFFVSRSLSAEFPRAREFSAQASGVIITSVSKLNNSFVLWFRQEIIQTVRWAGDPQKPALQPSAAQTQYAGAAGALPPGIVHPRHSFEEWLQIVRASSTPWLREEIDATSDFRLAVLQVVLKRAEELAAMAAGLQVANEELEAFSYSVSHDLRAPFRHISGFSEMLKEEEADRMSAKGKHYLATIMDSARFAGLLVDSLLDFSRFARSKFTMVNVNMEALVDQEWKAVLYDEASGRTIYFDRTELPIVSGDPQLLRQVLRNLLSNAVKYTGKESEARVQMEAHTEGQEFIFSITDNGVGFDQQYADKLFGVFQRLHRIEEFEGTGIGLANVRRIIGRHGGRVWAHGEVNKGATFYFSLPAMLPPMEDA